MVSKVALIQLLYHSKLFEAIFQQYAKMTHNQYIFLSSENKTLYNFRVKFCVFNYCRCSIAYINIVLVREEVKPKEKGSKF